MLQLVNDTGTGGAPLSDGNGARVYAKYTRWRFLFVDGPAKQVGELPYVRMYAQGIPARSSNTHLTIFVNNDLLAAANVFSSPVPVGKYRLYPVCVNKTTCTQLSVFQQPHFSLYDAVNCTCWESTPRVSIRRLYSRLRRTLGYTIRYGFRYCCSWRHVQNIWCLSGVCGTICADECGGRKKRSSRVSGSGWLPTYGTGSKESSGRKNT